MPLWAKVVLGILVALIVAIVAVSLTKSDNKDTPTTATRLGSHQRQARIERKERTRRRLKEARKREEVAKAREEAEHGEASVTGEAGPGEHGTQRGTPRAGESDLTSSFADLENEVPGSIGVAYSRRPGDIEQLGGLETGHAWSSFKVPIVVTLMRRQNQSLSSSQQALAASAITASDNSAAASLFSELESKTGNASAAVEESLAIAGAPTPVATAPPPPGAVSSWGQTDWPLAASTAFYGALACGAFGSATRELALADMENVISEQQWGLGQAEFPPGTHVAFKAGWGPDGSESGPYLVRQAGVLRSGEEKLFVTIAAQDSSGSFEAGVSDLNQVADWVASNLPFTSSC
jgi:hypothetical protein